MGRTNLTSFVVLGLVVSVAMGCGRRSYDGGRDGDGSPDARVGDPLCTDTGNGLLAWFPFEDDDPAVEVADASGNGIPARCDTTDTCPSITDGVIGQGLLFQPEVTDQLRVRISPMVSQETLFQSQAGLTVAAFVRLDVLPVDGSGIDADIVNKQVGSGDRNSWQLRVSDSGELEIDTDLAADSGTNSLRTPRAFNLGEAVHIAATWTGDGGRLRLYQRGSLSAESSEGKIAEFDSGEIWIGNDLDSDFDDPWTGMIDEVRIYDRALSAAEIEILAGCR